MAADPAQAALEFVEAQFDQDRYVPAVHGNVDRFPGAQEAGADGKIDVHVGELRAEGARLRSPSFGERDGADIVGLLPPRLSWNARQRAEPRSTSLHTGVSRWPSRPPWLSRPTA
jgi:hypothetical protein